MRVAKQVTSDAKDLKNSEKREYSLRKVKKAQTEKVTAFNKKRNVKKPQDESKHAFYDEIYELFKQSKAKKLIANREGQKNKKKNGIALKNIQISTPAEQRHVKRKKLLDFGLSPIGGVDDPVKEDENRAMLELCLSIRKQRRKEIKEQENAINSSAILRAEALLEKLHKPAESKILVKLEPKIKLQPTTTRNLTKRHLSLDDPSLLDDSVQPSTSSPSSQIRPEPSTSTISPEPSTSSISLVSSENCDKSVTPSNSIEFPPSAKKQLPVDHNLFIQNFFETLKDAVTGKSVNFVDSKVMRRSTRSSKQVSIAEETGDVTRNSLLLNPGKWRRSLIEWRKTKSRGKSSSLIPIDEEQDLSTRSRQYSMKLMETLGQSVLSLEQSDEGNLHAALSVLDGSIKCAATFHDQRKTSQRKTSVFDRSSIFFGLQQASSSLLIETNASSSPPPLTARQIALRRCGQLEPLPFDEVYSPSQLPNCVKIGEGVFGEVFMFKCPSTNQPVVLKLIPIEGRLIVNGEVQKKFHEILQEIVISVELSALRHCKDSSTDGFVNVRRVTCVKGAYPQHLIDEWELFRDNRPEGSENDHPEIFPDDQLYIGFELCNGGRDLEAFIFNNAQEAQSVFFQTALTLAVAEQKFEFEHRDLHWGNILIAPTTEKFVEYRINGEVIKIPTHGVKVTIIDYSLSRMVYDGAILYDNLARDEELFESTGDYQFDIYRLMRQRVENDFERYEPFTNLLWLHYIVDKLINGARYRYSKTKKHRSAIQDLMQERDELLNFASAFDYVNHSNF